MRRVKVLAANIVITVIMEHRQMNESLHASEEILKLFLDHAPASMAMFDSEMRYLAVSKGWSEDYFLGDKNIIGVSHYEIFPEIQERWKSVHRRGLAGEVIRADEDRFERLDGTIQWLRWEVLPWHTSDGAIGGIIMFTEDITPYKIVEKNIRHLNAALEQRVADRTAHLTAEIAARKASEQALMQYAAIIDSSDDAIIGKDLNGIITSWNGGAERMFGYSRDEALGRHITLLIPETHLHEEEMLLARIRNGQFVSHYETIRRCKKGYLIDVSVSLSPIRDQDKNIIGASKIARDITERKLLEDQVHQLAFYDELTKLPNRRVLYDRLNQAIAASSRNRHFGAVMFIDLDNLKPLNDNHGHAVGDLLLTAVAHRLKDSVRDIDTVARFGGDEFVVIVGELRLDKADSIAQANAIAEKIRVALSTPYLLTNKQEGKAAIEIAHRCTTSIGVAMFNHQDPDRDDILRQADAAMYQAKEAGRNSIRFSDIDS
jgi:diguanylate cyclase (GGDEF)-like protein/PAS domain S-box-containing protein